ncbi:MAG: acyl-CoA thioesterase [Azoarcus sp.]|jgi:acyl-CoA thioester hydrolase|nr:acyl-CoA thioesterase [Azoarcus sp.]
MKRNPKSAWQNEVELEIPFHDLDPLNICWHGHYVRYFEIARSALLRTFDYDYLEMRDSGYAWPVVDLQIRYIRPLHFRQRIVIQTYLMEWENRLIFEYIVRDAESKERLTRGRTTQVAVDIETGEMCLISPPVLKEKLGVK